MIEASGIPALNSSRNIPHNFVS